MNVQSQQRQQPQQQQTQMQVQEAWQRDGNPLGLPSMQEWNYIKDICATAVKSGMLPSSIRTPEAAAIIALKSRELGIPYMVGFSQICVINGKPAMQAELIQALARRNLPGLRFNILHSDSKFCEVEGQRPERGSVPFKLKFSIEEATQAKLTVKDVWKQYPAAMLRARATTALLRALCPGELMGISHTPEELGYDSADGQTFTPSTIETTGKVVEDPQPESAPAADPVPEPEPPKEEHPSKEQLKELFRLGKEYNLTPEVLFEEMKARFAIASSSELTLDQYNEMMVEIGKYKPLDTEGAQ